MREAYKRVLFTLGAILVFRAGCQLATPGVDARVMARLVHEHARALVGFFDMVSGGALERCSVFALGLQPFINASIVAQLLMHVFPAWAEARRAEGREGQKRVERWTRAGALALAVMQAWGVALMLEAWTRGRAPGLVAAPGWGFRLGAIAALTAGSAFLIALSDAMTAHGIGNGASVLIAAGIVARLPAAALMVAQGLALDGPGALVVVRGAGFAAALFALTALVVTVHGAVRKIPLCQARGTSHLPLKVNQGGVMPVIFASSVLVLPGLLVPALSGGAIHLAVELVLIVAFAYFYAGLELDPRAIAHALRRQGAFTPGVRAGAATARYIERVLMRITLAGGLFLGVVALAPHALARAFGGAVASAGLGGTSLLIVVGVILEGVRQFESLALERQYARVIRR